MDRASLSRIERMNYIFGGVLVAATGVLGTGDQVLGALLGVVLSAANFSLVKRLVERMLLAAQGAAGAGEGSARASGIALLPTMAVLLGAAAAALIFLPISAIMLAVGFSVFLVSIMVETVRYVLRSPANGGAGAD